MNRVRISSRTDCLISSSDPADKISAIASRTADFLGVKLYKTHVTEQTFAERLEDATWMSEQPCPDLNFIGLYALSELVREKGFRVIITGIYTRYIFFQTLLFLQCKAPSNNNDNDNIASRARGRRNICRIPALPLRLPH